MTPLFEIDARSIARTSWQECLHAPEASHLTVVGADAYQKTLGPPEGADDPRSPHYLGREVAYGILTPYASSADVDALCEAEWQRRCHAWRELRFVADLALVSEGGAYRPPRTGDPLQVFGYVGRLLEWDPVWVSGPRQRGEYRVRVEWD